MVLPGSAQQYQRRASIVRGGSSNEGKCTIEVEVDGAAQVEIRGDQGTVRNLSGQPAVWRRFECTGPIPTNPTSFRFEGVDGRGRMDLVQDPRNGGAAVIRIEDSKGGSEGYTFDLFWNGRGAAYSGGPGSYPGRDNVRRDNDRRDNDRRGNDRRDNNANADRYGNSRYNGAWAVRTCQQAVRERAIRQFRPHSIEFLDTRMDDNPGRNDWVIGRLDVLHGPGQPEERLSFSCSVNFNNGRVRSVNLERATGRYPHNEEGRWYGNDRVFNVCEQAVEQRIRQDGYNRVDILSTRTDDNPGRRDWIVGNARANRGRNDELFTYSCSVDFNRGTVRSVDVRRH